MSVNAVRTSRPCDTRQRFRFSLKAVLVAVTLASAWFGLVYTRVQDERRADEAIRAAGGDIVYDWQIRGYAHDPNSQPTPPGPEWLRAIMGKHWFEQIEIVELPLGQMKYANKRFADVGPHLARLSHLRLLSLWSGELDADEGCWIGRLKRLEELSCGSLEIPDEVAAGISRAPRVRKVSFNEVVISTRGLQALAALPRLEEFSLSCRHFDTRTGRSTEEHRLRDDGLRAIARCKQLRSLMVFHTRITDEGVRSLGGLSRLKTLTIGSPHITGASLGYISAALPRLEHLGAWQWQLEPKDLRALSRLPDLRNLDLLTELTDEHIPEVVAFRQLEFLRLRGKGVTEAALPQFRGLANLKRLDLDDTSIHKNGAAAMQLKAALPACHVLLPPTEEEKRIEQAFRDWKWLGGR